MALNITHRHIIALIILAALGTTTVNASSESLNWGFISTNVTIWTGANGTTVKFVSQVFAYCGEETTRKKILQDNELALREVVKMRYADNVFEITYNYVDTSGTEDKATSARNKELNTSYPKHESWQAGTSDYSSGCR